jgi:hypothetical protein
LRSFRLVAGEAALFSAHSHLAVSRRVPGSPVTGSGQRQNVGLTDGGSASSLEASNLCEVRIDYSLFGPIPHSSTAPPGRQADSPRHACARPFPFATRCAAAGLPALPRKSSVDTPRASASLQTVDHDGSMPSRSSNLDTVPVLTSAAHVWDRNLKQQGVHRGGAGESGPEGGWGVEGGPAQWVLDFPPTGAVNSSSIQFCPGPVRPPRGACAGGAYTRPPR